MSGKRNGSDLGITESLELTFSISTITVKWLSELQHENLITVFFATQNGALQLLQ